MSDNLDIRFADSLISLAPGFPMDAAEMVDAVKTQGFDSIITVANNYDPGIIEAAELLLRLGKGGMQDGTG